MVALHHALEDEDPKEIKKINQLYRNGQLPLPSTINPNLTPKYYKGKSQSDAYYGYKLVNGQAGELNHETNLVFYWCQDILKSRAIKKKKNHRTKFKN